VSARSSAPDSRRSRETLEQAYERYRAELRRFFEVNAPRTQAVDDLMQEMFLNLINSQPTAELRDAQRYLFRVAWNVLHSNNRRAGREPKHRVSSSAAELDSHAQRSNRLWVEDDCTSALAQEQLDRALSKLPALCQASVLLHYRDGRTYKQIALELGITVHTVKKYIMKALNEVRIEFNVSEDQ